MFHSLLYSCLAFVMIVAPLVASEGENHRWRYQSERASLEIDTTKTGQIAAWIVDGKTIVAPVQALSPIFVATTDGRTALFHATSHLEEKNQLKVLGRLSGKGIEAAAELRYTVQEKGAQLVVTVNVTKPDFQSAAVSEFSWALPLALEPRKLVYFRGDHGFDWETRYFYQLTVESAGHLLAQAERNEWRYFGLDQVGKNAFRLWRSESDTTSPLIMQQGKSAVPYVQIYDQSGGVTVEVPNLAAHAPQSLRVDAAGGGKAMVEFWSKSSVPAEASASYLFDESHQIILHANVGKNAVVDTRTKLNAKSTPSPVVEPEAVMQEPEWVRTTPASLNSPQYVTGGYPFAQGALRDLSTLRVSAAGKGVPVQSKPLGFWPDGSMKWVQLTFPVDPSSAVAECPSPRVSFRNGKFVPVEIRNDGPASPAKHSLGVNQTEETIVVRNETLVVELGKGTDWLKSLALDGRELLSSSKESRQAYTDYLVGPKRVFPLDLKAEGGAADRGLWKVDQIAVEESGPLRAVVRLEGMTSNAEATRVIIRIEFLAGRSELRITHSSEFRFKDPRQTFLTGMGVEIPFDRTILGTTAFSNFSEFAEPSKVNGGQLFQASPFQAELELKRENRWNRVADTGASQGWIHSKGEAVQMVAAIRNFWQEAPRSVAVAFDEGALRFELWPNAAGPMDVRRYSNYPHRSQGESVEAKDDWVEKTYYPEDPFVGVSRSSEMLLSLAPASGKLEAASLAADFQSPPLLYAGEERYAQTGVLLPSTTRENWPRAYKAWTTFANFWLYHRELHSWYGMWNFGDFRHSFQKGYGWILSPEALIEMRKLPLTGKGSNKRPARALRKLDYQPPNDWAFDNGRWGWSNTEGLPGLFLQHEYLRHGNRVVYFAAEAMARHSRDVIIRHEGKWFGRGTRHGVQPWSDGNHEERQTTVTEYRLHYFLSGEARTRDVINKLYDGIYSKTPVNVDAAHSGRLGGLFFHWEITGSPAEAEQFKNYTRLFLSPEGLYTEPNVHFPGPQSAGEPKGLNDGTMFFHTFGGLHALMEYQQITQDPEIKASLIKFAETVLANGSYGNGKVSDGGMLWPVIAFAARHADNPLPYQQSLQRLIQKSGWQLMYQTVTQNPAHWSGPTGYLSSSVPMSFFWANWAPYTSGALGSDTLWNPQVAEQFDAIEGAGNLKKRMPVSLQTEFDGIPELEDYLGYQQPWREHAK